VALAYVARSLTSNWQALSEYRQQFDVRFMAGAWVAIALSRVLLALAAREAFAGLGFSLDRRTMSRAYHLAGLSAYVPGGIYVGRPVIFAQIGVDVVSTGAGILIEQSSISLLELVGAVPYLVVMGAGPLGRYWFLGVLLILPMLVFVHPAVMNRLLRWVLKRLGYADRAINLTFGQLARMLMFQFGAWLVGAVGSILSINSVYRAPPSLWPLLASARSLSSFLGRNLSMTPGGLGVREGVSTLLTSPLLPAPVPALMAVIGRLSHTGVVLILFAVAALMGNRAREATAAPSSAEE
jgi:hypothetical protein